jgi:hypothetical protein
MKMYHNTAAIRDPLKASFSDDETIETLHPSRKLPLLNYRLESLYHLCFSQEKTLRRLRERAAHYGPLDVPISLQSQIKETEDTIKGLESEIERLDGVIAQIKKEIGREKRQQTATPHKGCFGIFSDWPAFNQYTREACEIFVAGGSLDNLTQIFGPYLVRKAEDGCEVRLILMDPTSPAIPQVERWSDPEGLPKDYYRRAVCRSLKRLAHLDEDRKLKVRLDPSIPALTVLIVDGSHPHGKIRVDIQPFQATVDVRPVFELTRQQEDLQWYEMFYRQYSEKLWEMAKEVDLDDLPQTCLDLAQSDIS